MKKVKLDLNLPILDQSGKEVLDTTLAQALGGCMLNSENTSEVNILKYFTWALELGKTGELELDAADVVLLKNYIIENPTLFIIVKAPILKELEKLEFE